MRGSLSTYPAWQEWTDFVLCYYGPVLMEIDLYNAIKATRQGFKVHRGAFGAMLETFCPDTNTCFTPNGELGLSLWEIKDITGLPILGDLYEEYVPTGWRI